MSNRYEGNSNFSKKHTYICWLNLYKSSQFAFIAVTRVLASAAAFIPQPVRIKCTLPEENHHAPPVICRLMCTDLVLHPRQFQAQNPPCAGNANTSQNKFDYKIVLSQESFEPQIFSFTDRFGFETRVASCFVIHTSQHFVLQTVLCTTQVSIIADN